MSVLVDILLATYEGESYLHEQIQSIFNQTYQRFHIWIRDDHSLDKTRSLLQQKHQSYPESITLLPIGPKLGVKRNFSELMKHSTAPYILFADQDDIWLPNKIEITLQKMQALELQYGPQTPLLVHTDLKVVGPHLDFIAESFWKYCNLNPYFNTLNRLFIQNIVTGCTMMINRSLLQLSQPVPDEAIMHDWWIALIASAFGKIACVDQPTILYRQHGRNDTGAKKYGLWEYWKLKLNGRHFDQTHQTYQQAEQFFKHYHSLLDSNQKQMVKAYYSLGNLSFLKQKKTILHYQFFKHGILRNLHLLLKT
jgi:glycosyltransferase involved in cell wall biosynthesis